MKKIEFDDLVKSRQLQRESRIGRDQISVLLKRADKDLESSLNLKDIDPALSMDAAYKAMFHAAGALLKLHALRAGPVRQHQGVIVALSRILGTKAEFLMTQFDRLRKRRNQFEYQGLFEMGDKELEEALKNATELVEMIKKSINFSES